MSVRLGNTAINKLYLGDTAINKVYLGNNLIYPNNIELFTTSAAAIGANETNDTSGWGFGGAIDLISQATDVQDGNYALKATYNQDAGSTSHRISYNFPTEVGATYNVSFWAKSTGANSRSWLWTGTSDSTAQVFNSEWQYYTETVTATGTTIQMRFFPGVGGTGNLGVEMFIDNISVVKNTISNSILDASPVAYWTSDSIDSSAINDGDNVSIWEDTIGGNNFMNTNGQPTLHIGTNGNRMVEFDGVDDLMQLANGSLLSYTGQTDEWSIVMKIGDIIDNNGIGILTKSSTGSAFTFQYEMSVQDDRTAWRAGGQGGTDFNFGGLGNDLLIMTVSTTTISPYVNGNVLSAYSVGNHVNTIPLTLGGRAGSSQDYKNCQIEFVAIFDKVLSTSEMNAINTEFNVN
ncbi:hypothetical protein [Winogradskyella sp.]|uniref:hypothetical protein n=1 Tax=Winogradskyella sp. TaxID=1883156 RepID=UPI0026147D33|nr:hypothetical protein [Winogradskyella sp.]